MVRGVDFDSINPVIFPARWIKEKMIYTIYDENNNFIIDISEEDISNIDKIYLKYKRKKKLDNIQKL